MPKAEKLLRLSTAATRLTVNPKTLKRWIHRGLIRGVKLDGGHWRVPEAEVEKRLSQK